MIRPLLAALAACAVLTLAGCGGSSQGSTPPAPPPIPAPTEPPAFLPSRRGLLFAYFGAMQDETLGFVNATFAGHWGDTDLSVIAGNIMAAQARGASAAILDLGNACYSPGAPRRYLGSAATANVRAIFSALQQAGALAFVRILYPIDEPERDSNIPEVDIIACNADLRAVAVEFPELAGVRLACIYGDGEDYRGLVSYDLVGFDAYGMGTDAMGAQYDRLATRLLPGQQTILVPGCCDPWRAAIGPWYDKAQQSPEVGLVMPFLYDDTAANLGIRSNGRAPECNAAAAAIRAA